MIWSCCDKHRRSHVPPRRGEEAEGARRRHEGRAGGASRGSRGVAGDHVAAGSVAWTSVPPFVSWARRDAVGRVAVTFRATQTTLASGCGWKKVKAAIQYLTITTCSCLTVTVSCRIRHDASRLSSPGVVVATVWSVLTTWRPWRAWCGWRGHPLHNQAGANDGTRRIVLWARIAGPRQLATVCSS